MIVLFTINFIYVEGSTNVKNDLLYYVTDLDKLCEECINDDYCIGYKGVCKTRNSIIYG